MKILSIRRLEGPGANARVDVEINDYLRLYGLQLKQTESGHRIFAGRVAGKHSASFHPLLARQITDAALAALEGNSHGGS